MQADIGHGPELALAVTDHQNRLTGEFVCQVVSGLCQCTGAPDTDPVLFENIRQFRLKELLARVDGRWHGQRILERPPRRLQQFLNRSDRGHLKASARQKQAY